MQYLVWVILALNITLVGLFVYSRLVKKLFLSLVFKTLSAVCFVILALVCFINTTIDRNFFILILGGLIFGLVGDVILGCKDFDLKLKPKMIIFGASAFLIGHIFYSVAFGTRYQLSWFVIVAIVVLTVFMQVVSSILKKTTFKQLDYKYILYSLAISCNIALALNCFVMSSLNTGYLIALIGGCLFMVSDIVLSSIYNNTSRGKIPAVINMVTYFSAQILFSLSILYI